jgi:hypothetical protein
MNKNKNMLKKKIILAVAVLTFAAGSAIAVPTKADASIFGGEGSGDLGRLIILSKLFNDKGDGVFKGSGDGIDLGNLIILSRLFNQDIFGRQPVTAPTAVSPAPTAPAAPAPAPISRNLSREFSGRILLQANENGQAWYVNPTDGRRYSLGSPSSAFNLMSNVAVGVSNADFESFEGQAPSNLSGRFVIKPEDNGELYYVNPTNRQLTFIDGPSGALGLMSSTGIGISNNDLSRISAAN